MPGDNDSSSLATRLTQIEDREAIKELKAAYARGADAVFNNPGHASAVVLSELFTQNGVLDLGGFGRFEGRPALLNAFENILPQGTKWSTHYILSPIIEFTAEDKATATWYFRIESVPAGEGATQIAILGNYTDKYRKTPGGWKIRETLTGYFIPPV